MEEERTTYSCSDYLHGDRYDEGGSDCGDRSDSDDDDDDEGSTCSSRATIHLKGFSRRVREDITPADRMKLTDWCFAIVDRCRFQRETVATAMNLVDRFVGAPSASPAGSPAGSQDHDTEASFDRAAFQLVVVTALYISIKLNERTTFGSQDFVAASRGMYSVEDIQCMELKILHVLSWRVHPPTGFQVATQILSLMLPDTTKIKPGTLDLLREEVAYQTENAVRDYYFVTQRPSTVAAAAIMNAIEAVDHQDHEYLTNALASVLEKFPFESQAVLSEARDQLLLLTNEEEDDESIATREPEWDEAPARWEESRSAIVGEDTLDPRNDQVHHRLVQETLGRILSSPRSVVCNDAWDDCSCATVY